MARIYIGRSTGIGQFERHVVLKVITPERANDAVAVNMFLDEARLAASLNHQNVAQVFEVGADEGIHYLAMEYVHGQDLRALLAKAGGAGTRIPLELALTVVAGAAAGLNHAHERRGPDGVPLGIVHRDVSPSNIMIGYDGAVKLLDFGIAKATMRSVETQSGIIKGKFAYMAPEQCRGRDVDRRSDVFSLGIILYEISTQHRCFRADSDFDTMHRIVTGDVMRPTRLVQGYPQALEAIVMKALAIDANQRYQSAGQLLEAIESFAVASRMSLSTMGLGRFMRDMFGEVQEPWLNNSANNQGQPEAPKESTISSTDSRSEVQPRIAQTTNPIRNVATHDSDEPDEDDDNMQTVLQLPGRESAAHLAVRSDSPTDPPYGSTLSTPSGPPSSTGRGPTNAHVVPADPSSHLPLSGLANANAPQSSHNATLLGVPGSLGGPGSPTAPVPGRRATSVPGVPTMPVGNAMHGAPPPAPFHQTPPSSSGPAIPPGFASTTKHGYASGAGQTRGDASYPQYDHAFEPVGSAEVQLSPNRRPLIIGLVVVTLGIIVMLAVTLGGSKDEPSALEDDRAPTPSAGPAVPTKPAPLRAGSSAEVIDDNMVSIVIESEPTGADVLIAGAKIGTTPFDQKLKRGTKVQTLTLRKAGFADFVGKIDLSGEYENKNIKLLTPEEAAKAGATGGGEASPIGSGAAPGTGSSASTGTSSGAATTGTAMTGTATKTGTGTTATTGTATKTGTGTTATTKTGTGTTATTGATSIKTGTAGTTTGTATKTGTTGTTSTGTATKTGTTGATSTTGTATKTGTTGTTSTTGTATKTGTTGTGTKTNTGTGTATKKPKCQPPGPNVDPFGLPVCKS